MIFDVTGAELLDIAVPVVNVTEVAVDLWVATMTISPYILIDKNLCQM